MILFYFSFGDSGDDHQAFHSTAETGKGGYG